MINLQSDHPEEFINILACNLWLKQIGRHDVVYLSGPMSNLPDFNRPRFKLWEHVIKISGARVLSPAYADQKRIYHQLIRDGLRMVIEANVTIMLDGWRDSNGANVEWTASILCGNRMYYERVPHLLKEKVYE